MHLIKFFRSLAVGLALVVGALSPLATSQAAMIGTDALITSAEQSLNRDQLKSTLAREDVAEQLESYGVSADDALIRVDRMTDEEVNRLNEKFGKLPAGGDIPGREGSLRTEIIAASRARGLIAYRTPKNFAPC